VYLQIQQVLFSSMTITTIVNELETIVVMGKQFGYCQMQTVMVRDARVEIPGQGL
jgi:hypothetical protein